MPKPSLTPLKAEYDRLCQSKKDKESLTLVITHEAEWLIIDLPPKTDVNLFLTEHEREWQVIFAGWENFLHHHSHNALKTIHKFAWPDTKIGKALETREALSVLIWNYRISKATDKRKSAQVTVEGAVKDPLQRASSIAGRTYMVITPSADAKKFTSPAGLACLKIITDCCGESKICSEGDLKVLVMSRAAEITPKTDSAWRFLQFYRPLLVESELITYKK